MDISTFNVVLGVGATFFCSMMLIGIGVIGSYVRQINRNTKETYGAVIEHKTEIKNIKETQREHSDKIYQLQKNYAK